MGTTMESSRIDAGAAWAPSPSPGAPGDWAGCDSPGGRPPRGSRRGAAAASPRGGAAPGAVGISWKADMDY